MICNQAHQLLLQVITGFLNLETVLDDSVDKTLGLQIERGGSARTVNLMVGL